MYGYDSYGGLHAAGIAGAVFVILLLVSFVASIALTVLGYIKFARVPGEKLFDFASKDAVGPFLRFDTFLLERILNDPIFGLTLAELQKLVDPHAFTGMAVHQTETFLREQVTPVLNKYTTLLGCDASINV